MWKLIALGIGTTLLFTAWQKDSIDKTYLIEDNNASSENIIDNDNYMEPQKKALDENDQREPQESKYVQIWKQHFEEKNQNYNPYLDIDNDGIKEKTIYNQEIQAIQIIHNDNVIIETHLYSLEITFNDPGNHSTNYFFEYVRDVSDTVYMHIYTCDGFEYYGNGHRKVAASEAYLQLQDSEWIVADYINYQWERSPQFDSTRVDIFINNQPVESLESIEARYSKIEDSRYEIPFW